MQLSYGGLIACRHAIGCNSKRVGAGPACLEGTTWYDAEAHCTLADAERDRNALVISAAVSRRAPHCEMENVALQFSPYAKFLSFTGGELV